MKCLWKFYLSIRNEDCGLGRAYSKSDLVPHFLPTDGWLSGGREGKQERCSPCLYGSHILKGKTDMLIGTWTAEKTGIVVLIFFTLVQPADP